MANDYSDTWYKVFLQPVPARQTESEIAFITCNLPRPSCQSIVDLCCGNGRHTRLLADKGYQVTGVDNNAQVLEQAKALSDPRISYISLDMRRISDLQGTYDALVCLWQSFGYFDDMTNLDILRQIGQKLNPKGRLMLDIYNRAFFEKYQGERSFQKEGITVIEHKAMSGNRLKVSLTYSNDAKADIFDWQLFYPDELAEDLAPVGFKRLLACTGFDEKQPPSPDKPRMQLVFEKIS